MSAARAHVPRVLLVEDDAADARSCMQRLRESTEPFEVTHVVSMADALERLARPPSIDAILLALALPARQGLDALAAVLLILGIAADGRELENAVAGTDARRPIDARVRPDGSARTDDDVGVYDRIRAHRDVSRKLRIG